MIRLVAMPMIRGDEKEAQRPPFVTFEQVDAYMAEKLDRHEIDLDGFRIVLRTVDSLLAECCGDDPLGNAADTL